MRARVVWALVLLALLGAAGCSHSLFEPPEMQGPAAMVESGGQARLWLLSKQEEQRMATVTPNADTGSVLLICEPEAGAWSDWFRVDDGTNLENSEAVARAITRRVAARRRGEQAETAQTHVEKELTAAKLSLLHAQVEPHFLYNTLASAQYLTRTDPALADQMLGNLITYLRHSLPRTDTAPSTLGEEVERARAYLEILKIRMPVLVFAGSLRVRSCALASVL